MEIKLRESILEDGEYIVKWRNNPEFLKHCMDYSTISLESNTVFYNENIVTGKYIQYMVEKVDSDFGGVFSYKIAMVYLKNLDNKNHRCECGIYPNEDGEWNDESKREAMRLLLDRAFNEYGFHKVYSYIFSDCEDELQLLRDVGFEQEGVFKDEICLKDGMYRDVIRMFKLKDNDRKDSQ